MAKIQGIKIRIINPLLIRRFGSGIIECDPTMARRYVEKGIAKYLNVMGEEPIIASVQNIKEKVIEYFFRETIFPSSIIPI